MRTSLLFIGLIPFLLSAQSAQDMVDLLMSSEGESEDEFMEFYVQNPELNWDSLITVQDEEIQTELAYYLMEILADVDVRQSYNLIHFLKESDEFMNSKFKARILSIEGSLLYQLGDTGGAIERFYSALELYDPVEDFEEHLEVSIEIAYVHAQMGDVGVAYPIVRQAIADAEENGDPELILTTNYYLAGLYGDEHKCDSAILLYRKILTMTELKDQNDFIYSYGEIAKCYGELGEYRKAVTNQLIGARLEGEKNDFSALIDSYGVLGVAYAGLGMGDSADYYLDKSMQLALELEAMDKELASHQAAYLSHQLLGDYESAFESLLSFNELLNEMNNEQVREIREEMRVKYESDQKEAENNLLASENENQRLLIYLVGSAVAIMAILGFFVIRNARRTRKLNLQISEQAVQLTNLNATKDKLFSIIAHDLRGPITSFENVQSVVSAYLEKGDTEKVKELIEQVGKSTSNLKLLLENLLNWSLRQQDAIMLDIKPIPLKSVVDEVVEFYSETAHLKEIEFRVDLSEEKVMADYDTLSTVIRNLLSNAIKFSPAGSRIQIGQKKDDHFLKISVTDIGVGMSEDQQSKLFKVDKSKVRKGTAKETGSGLGLVLVKEFVEMNGGTVEVDSKPGDGSTFSVRLPLAS